MAGLNDLNDKLLLMVLDLLSPKELMKMRLNKRLRRLANDKMRDKTTVIKLTLRGYDNSFFHDCHHLGSVNMAQQLILIVKESFFDTFQSLSEKDFLLLNLFSICSCVKSIHLGSFPFPNGFLLEVVRRCPELECIHFDKSWIKVEEWNQALDQIGPKLIHFGKVIIEDDRTSDVQMFELVAEKCPNIRQVGCSTYLFSSPLLSTFQELPESCWIKLKCNVLGDFEDVIDELDVYFLTPSFLGQRNERLSSLKFEFAGDGDDVDEDDGIEFAGLTTLEFRGNNFDVDSVNCLITSQFPSLEVFILTANGLSQDDYHQLFQGMPALKELTINSLLEDEDCQLPQLTSMIQLENLEIINLIFKRAPFEDWQPNDVLQLIEQYVDDISSLKKLVVDLSDYIFEMEWIKNAIIEVERMNLKQDRVEVKSVRKPSINLWRRFFRTLC